MYTYVLVRKKPFYEFIYHWALSLIRYHETKSYYHQYYQRKRKEDPKYHRITNKESFTVQGNRVF